MIWNASPMSFGTLSPNLPNTQLALARDDVDEMQNYNMNNSSK